MNSHTMVVDGEITEIRDKQKVLDANFLAFVGLCFIKNHDIFFDGLENSSMVNGELQDL